ncbi:MAG: hypothetical protein WA081_08630 [Desulfosalsimonadaceae bacterium]
MTALNAFAADGDSRWAPLLNAAFKYNDLETAVTILVNDKNVPVSDIIVKARTMGFDDTRIADALVGTKLSCEQVIIEVLQNNVPPEAIFNSQKICGTEYGYTPEKILRFLVKEFRWVGTEERRPEKYMQHLEIIIEICKSMMGDKGYSQYDVMYNLCLAEADRELISEVSKRLDVPQATTFKACPKHAEYGRAYISHELPQQAHIVIGVDHLTIDDDSGRGIISSSEP